MQTEKQHRDFLAPAEHERRKRWWHECRVSMVSAMGWDNERGWGLPRRHVEDVFFLMPLDGEVEVELDGHRDMIRRGRTLMLAPGVKHRLQLSEESPRLFQMALHCHLYDTLSLPVDLSGFPPCIELSHPEWAIEQWKIVTHAMHTDRNWGIQRGESFVRELLQDVVGQYPQVDMQSGPTDKRVRTAMAYIHRFYSEAITVEDLADQVGLKPVRFRRIFKEAIGRTPKAYIAQYRLTRAKDWLRSTNLSVKEIARRTGFDTDMYFHLCFKKAVGQTPRAYRSAGAEL